MSVKRKAAIERQQFVTWYTPEEKLPDEGHYTLVTFSGSVGKSIWYEHAFGVAAYWPDEELWEIETPNYHVDDLVIHAWCDIEPYQGGEWKVDL